MSTNSWDPMHCDACGFRRWRTEFVKAVPARPALLFGLIPARPAHEAGVRLTCTNCGYEKIVPPGSIRVRAPNC